MSTKVYTLNFTGAAMLPLPQGRFFMIKTATAALSIECRRRDGQPVSFSNVGAGLQYKALGSDLPWYSMEVTSALAQVVEIVISDEAEISFANTVTVAGGVSVSELPAAALSTPAADAIANGAALAVAANPARRRVTVCAASTNAGSVYVQSTGAGAGRGIELAAGASYTVVGTYAFDVRNDSGAAASVTRFEES